MPAKKIQIQYDHMRIPILGMVPETSATAPSSPANGQMYLDTSVTPARMRYWQASASVWITMDGSVVEANAVGTSQLQDNAVTNNKLAGSIALSKLAVDPTNRANHSGTQTASTISDLATTVKAYRLDEFAAPTASLNANSQRITNVGAPTNSSDAARLLDVQNAQAGIDNKPSVRAATTGNISLTGTQTIDGVAIADGERVLVKNQTTTTQNGLYVASTGAWSRTNDTLTANTFVFVEEGSTQADTSWMITNNGSIVIGTTNIVWGQFGSSATYTAGTGLTLNALQFSLTIPVAVSSGGTGATTAAGAKTNLGFTTRYAQDLPAISAGASTTVTHGLNTSDLSGVVVTQTATGDVVDVGVRVTGVNTVSVQSDIAVAAGALRIAITG